MIKHKKRKGFTLIELLMVVAIIAILASIILIALNSSRERAVVGRYTSYATQMHRLVADAVAAGYFDAGVSQDITTGSDYCLGAYPGGDCWGASNQNTNFDAALTKLTDFPDVTDDNAYSPYNPTYGVVASIDGGNTAITLRMYLLSGDTTYLQKVCSGINWDPCNGDSCCVSVPLNSRMRREGQ